MAMPQQSQRLADVNAIALETLASNLRTSTHDATRLQMRPAKDCGRAPEPDVIAYVHWRTVQTLSVDRRPSLELMLCVADRDPFSDEAIFADVHRLGGRKHDACGQLASVANVQRRAARCLDDAEWPNVQSPTEHDTLVRWVSQDQSAADTR